MEVWRTAIMHHDDEKMVDLSPTKSSSSGRSSPTWKQSTIMDSYNRYAKRRFIRPVVIGLCLVAALLRFMEFQPIPQVSSPRVCCRYIVEA